RSTAVFGLAALNVAVPPDPGTAGGDQLFGSAQAAVAAPVHVWAGAGLRIRRRRRRRGRTRGGGSAWITGRGVGRAEAGSYSKAPRAHFKPFLGRRPERETPRAARAAPAEGHSPYRLA